MLSSVAGSDEQDFIVLSQTDVFPFLFGDDLVVQGKGQGATFLYSLGLEESGQSAAGLDKDGLVVEKDCHEFLSFVERAVLFFPFDSEDFCMGTGL